MRAVRGGAPRRLQRRRRAARTTGSAPARTAPGDVEHHDVARRGPRPALDGPSNIPRSSPVDESPQLKAAVRPSCGELGDGRAEQRGGRRARAEEVVEHTAQRRVEPASSSAARRATSRAARSTESSRRSRPAARSAASSTARAGSSRSPASGLSRTRPFGSERDGPGAHGFGEGGVLALRVDDDAAPPRDDRAGEQALHERALAPADLARDEHVGVRDKPLGVRVEGVEAEHAAERARADRRRRPASPPASPRPGRERRRVPRREQLGPRADRRAPPHGTHQPGTDASTPRRWSPSQRRSRTPHAVASASRRAAAASSSSTSRRVERDDADEPERPVPRGELRGALGVASGVARRLGRGEEAARARRSPRRPRPRCAPWRCDRAPGPAPRRAGSAPRVRRSRATQSEVSTCSSTPPAGHSSTTNAAWTELGASRYRHLATTSHPSSVPIAGATRTASRACEALGVEGDRAARRRLRRSDAATSVGAVAVTAT